MQCCSFWYSTCAKHVGYIHVHIVGLPVAIFARYCTLPSLPNHETTTITIITSITTSKHYLYPYYHHNRFTLARTSPHTIITIIITVTTKLHIYKNPIIIGISIYRNSTIIIKQTTTTKNNNYQRLATITVPTITKQKRP
jgi:hypothetical protein